VEGPLVIRFQRPQLPSVAAAAAYFERAESARWYSNFGPCHELLVERLEQRVGAPAKAVPVANCTLGLCLALKALTENQAGNEVLLPSFTFAATAAAVEWAGLRPVFVDVAEGHWSMDPARLEAALEQRHGRIAAVLACTTFGSPPPLAVSDAWTRLSGSAGVPLVIDSAAGFGATDASGRPAGHLGDAEVFSFHATKPLAIGEGGVVFTGDPEVALRIRRLANFGFEDGAVEGSVGMNAKLAEWPAATALAALDAFDETLRARRAAAAALKASLDATDLQFQELDSRPAWQFVPALTPVTADRGQVVRHAGERGVEVRTYFSKPLHTMTPFRSAPRCSDLVVTNDLARRVISLPMATDQTHAEREIIVGAISETLSLSAAP
jgi:dTDP-4-amino-4,6-dideoxygalactose transaminase